MILIVIVIHVFYALLYRFSFGQNFFSSFYYFVHLTSKEGNPNTFSLLATVVNCACSEGDQEHRLIAHRDFLCSPICWSMHLIQYLKEEKSLMFSCSLKIYAKLLLKVTMEGCYIS